MQTKTLLTVATLAAASLAFAAPAAHAGFTATSGTDNVTVLFPTPSVGNTLIINNNPNAGTLATYTPDTPADPQIGNSGTNDIALYGYTINALGTTLNTDGSVTYAGIYEIFYNTDGNDTRDGTDISVSAGNITFVANQIGNTQLQVTAGELMQLTGPANPAFADLSYGGSNVGFVGFINVPTVPGTSGTANLTFRQNAPIPEPATAGLIGVAAAGLLARRRRA